MIRVIEISVNAATISVASPFDTLARQTGNPALQQLYTLSVCE
jgi:hypothetical protein